QMPLSLPLWNTYRSVLNFVAAIPDDESAVGMLALLQELPLNRRRARLLSERRPIMARLPGVLVSATAPAAGSTYAVVRTTGAGGVQPCAGACSAVELSTAAAVLHA